MAKKIDINGRIFGRWRVICEMPRRKGKPAWLCECECGGRAIHPTWVLTCGHSRSCGCSKKDRLTTHGLWHYSAYRAWSGMISRCHDPRHASWKSYGGRGIQVCERWLDVANFIADMGERAENMSLERIDVNGHYDPRNCKWATDEEQRANTRSNRYLEINGEKLHFNAAARRFDISNHTLRKRIKAGWAQDDALRLPLRSKKPMRKMA